MQSDTEDKLSDSVVWSKCYRPMSWLITEVLLPSVACLVSVVVVYADNDTGKLVETVVVMHTVPSPV